MKGFLSFLIGVYAMNFGFGYYGVWRAKPTVFCQKLFADPKGWDIALMLVGLPGEANACLDFGLWKKDGK